MNLLWSLRTYRSDENPAHEGPQQGGAVAPPKRHRPIRESPTCTGERPDEPSGRGEHGHPRRKESGSEAPPGGTAPNFCGSEQTLRFLSSSV